jgi:hypothetical protein
MKREEPKGQRIGTMKSKLVLPADFNAPSPDDLLNAFEGCLLALPSYLSKYEKPRIEKPIRDRTMERDIFSELMDGTEALADERQGRVTLRTHKINLPKRVPVTAEEVVSIRQQLDPSRAQMRKL